MHRLPAALVFAVLTTVKAVSVSDNDKCLSLYVTFWGDEPPPETYVLSSRTYSIATAPWPTLGQIPPNPGGGTNAELPSPSIPAVWDPTTVAFPPILTLPPLISTSPIQNPLPSPPLPTPHASVPFPLLNRTSAQNVPLPLSIPPVIVASSPAYIPPLSSTFGGIIPLVTTDIAIDIFSTAPTVQVSPLVPTSAPQYPNIPLTTTTIQAPPLVPTSAAQNPVIFQTTLTTQAPLLVPTSAPQDLVISTPAIVNVLQSSSQGLPPPVASISTPAPPLSSTTSTIMLQLFPPPTSSNSLFDTLPAQDIATSIQNDALLSSIAPLLMQPSASPSAAVPPAPVYDFPNCGPTIGTSPSAWDNIYTGAGYSESPDNPGNPGDPPPITSDSASFTIEFSETYACYVVEQCIIFATGNGVASIDVHVVKTSGDAGYWQCVGYPHQVGTGEYFTIQNPSILAAYGYDLVPVRSAQTSSNIALPPNPTTVAPPVIVHSSTYIISPPLSTLAGLTPTDNGVCGNGITCLGWPLGQCCSEYAYCGSDAGFCGAGCQSQYGLCGMPIPPSSTSPALLVSSVMNVMQISSTLDINIIPSASPTPSTPSGLTPTDDGVCGNGVTCLGWPDGQCCSEYGYCGSDAGFCGIGCQSEFGICGMPAPPSSSLPPAVPSSTIAAPAMSSSAAPNCPSSASLDAYNCGTYYTETGTYAGFVWDQLFIGSCLTEDPNNPGNDPESPAITNEIASGTTAAMLAGACGYLNACMNWAIPQAYDNVDFHLLQDTADTAHWECVAYYDNAGGNYFDVTNYNVLLAYGYDVE